MGTCKNCKFWESAPPEVSLRDAVQIGLCKRRSPFVKLDDKLSTPQWPSTRHCDWCGDFDYSIDLDEFEINL
jgi:hypothetical protein